MQIEDLENMSQDEILAKINSLESDKDLYQRLYNAESKENSRLRARLSAIENILKI